MPWELRTIQDHKGAFNAYVTTHAFEDGREMEIRIDAFLYDVKGDAWREEKAQELIDRSEKLAAARAAGKASCDRSCKFWTYDMDGVYCTHPKSFEIAPTFGASTNRMSLEGLCQTNKYGNTPPVAYALWEPR